MKYVPFIACCLVPPSSWRSSPSPPRRRAAPPRMPCVKPDELFPGRLASDNAKEGRGGGTKVLDTYGECIKKFTPRTRGRSPTAAKLKAGNEAVDEYNAIVTKV